MNAARIKSSIDGLLTFYRTKLQQIPDELFTESPKSGGWSYSEVYAHILQANNGSLICIKKCAEGSGITESKKTPMKARVVLWAGRFPPGKIKAPAHIAQMVVKMSKTEISELFDKVNKRLEEAFPNVESAPVHYKMKHPRLGLLNSRQWLRFMEIHMQHHVKQLRGLDKNFGHVETFFK